MRFLLALMAATALSAVSAHAARIRSGEHADFTRLVVEFDAPVDWSFGRTGEGYTLQSDGLNSPLDLSRVYDLIPRDRIANIAVDPETGQLVLEVECTCHGDAFEIRDGRVVLDIKDGPAPPNSPFEVPISAPSTSWVEDEMPADPDPVPETQPAPPPTPVDTAAFRDALVNGLSRAMTQGLLTPDLAVPAPSPQSRARAKPEPPVASEVPEADPRSSDLDLGISALTQVEVDRLQRFLANKEIEGTNCARIEAIDVTFTASDPLEVIARERAALFDPMGRLSDEAAFSLSNAYLSVGFGAEALEVLALVDRTDPRARPFKAIAAILEGQALEDENPFWGQIECRGAYVIWELLSLNAPGRLDDEVLRGIHLHFLELPRALRLQVGPRLGEKLAEGGYLAAANALRDSLVRASAGDETDVAQLDAVMAEVQGDPIKAIAVLEDALVSGAEDVPSVLLHLFHLYNDVGRTASEETRLLLSSYAFELQGTATGDDLALLDIFSKLETGDLLAAAEAIEAFESSARPMSASEANRVFHTTLESKDDFSFVRLVSRLDALLLRKDLDPDLFEMVVQRVASAQFLDLAESLAKRSTKPGAKAELQTQLADRRTRVMDALESPAL